MRRPQNFDAEDFCGHQRDDHEISAQPDAKDCRCERQNDRIERKNKNGYRCDKVSA